LFDTCRQDDTEPPLGLTGVQQACLTTANCSLATAGISTPDHCYLPVQFS
jgi:hypothetical protein